MASSKIPSDPLSFILRHVLAVDEMEAEGSLIQVRKHNLQMFQDHIYDSFVGKLVTSLGYKHRLIPSGSTFEGLSLPHINVKIFASDALTGKDRDAFISDVDVMCAFSEVTVREAASDSYFPILGELNLTASDRGLNGPKQNTDSLAQTVPTNDVLLQICQTQFPRYYKLKAVNRDSFHLPWQQMTVSGTEHGNDFFLSRHQFCSYFHEKGTKYFKDNPHPFHDDQTTPEIHGPALYIPIGSQSDKDGQFKQMMSEDIVWSLDCDWPKDALEWTRRRRKTGWLDEKLITEILNGRCNLVPHAPAQCEKEDRDLFWRLSFSQAEIKLAEQITWVQRKCYMVLKGLHYTHFSKPPGISTYHLKTALFWLLDDELSTTFTNYDLSSSFVKLVSKVLDFLHHRKWPNYFIPANNMISHLSDEVVQELFEKICYVRDNLLKCLEECQDDLVNSQSFNDNFGPVLEAIKSGVEQSSRFASAYIDSLLNIGNFYLITSSPKHSLPYFEEAFEYASEAIREHPVEITDVYEDLLQMLSDHSVEIGDVDRAIHYTELTLATLDIPEKRLFDDKLSVTLANLGCLFNIKYLEGKWQNLDSHVSSETTQQTRSVNDVDVVKHPLTRHLYDSSKRYFKQSTECLVVSALSLLEYANFLYCNKEFAKAMQYLLKSIKELGGVNHEDATTLTTDDETIHSGATAPENHVDHVSSYSSRKQVVKSFDKVPTLHLESNSDEDSVHVQATQSSIELYEQCGHVMNYGKLEKYTVDCTIRDVIESHGMFQAPAIVYARYLLARCFQRIGREPEAIVEASRLHDALQIAYEIYGRTYMLCGFDVAIELCKDLKSDEVLDKITSLQMSAVSSSESSSDESPEAYRMMTTTMSNTTEEEPFGASLGGLMQSHLVVDGNSLLTWKKSNQE